MRYGEWRGVAGMVLTTQAVQIDYSVAIPLGIYCTQDLGSSGTNQPIDSGAACIIISTKHCEFILGVDTKIYYGRFKREGIVRAWNDLS